MGTHIIWRNPSPPAKVEFKLRRLAGNEFATVYQVASPNYRHPFELVRTVPVVQTRVATRKAEPAVALAPGAELVLARW